MPKRKQLSEKNVGNEKIITWFPEDAPGWVYRFKCQKDLYHMILFILTKTKDSCIDQSGLYLSFTYPIDEILKSGVIRQASDLLALSASVSAEHKKDEAFMCASVFDDIRVSEKIFRFSMTEDAFHLTLSLLSNVSYPT